MALLVLSISVIVLFMIVHSSFSAVTRDGAQRTSILVRWIIGFIGAASLLFLIILVLFLSALLYGAINHYFSYVILILLSISISCISLWFIYKKNKILLFSLALIGVIPHIVFSIQHYYGEKDNAINSFGKYLEIGETLASKYTHNEIFGCTFIVVKYKGQNPVLIPAKNENTLSVLSLGVKPWNGFWKNTPIANTKDGWRNIIEICSPELPDSVAHTISTSLIKEGSFYTRNMETIKGVIPKSNIAFKIRYGD